MQKVRVVTVSYMMTVVLGAGLLWAACHPPQRATSSARPPAVQMARVTRISATCVTETQIRSWSGSAVIVGPSSLVTAEHVVNCAGTLLATAIGEDGAPAIILVEATAPQLDMAAVSTLVPAWPGARGVVVGPPPELGAEVCLVSATPLNMRQCGRVNGASGQIFEHDAFVEPGNSGGGVYDLAGRLVGIISTYRICSAGGLGQVCGGGFGLMSEAPWLTK
jgi:S1-C subfamily serine protease